MNIGDWSFWWPHLAVSAVVGLFAAAITFCKGRNEE